MKKVFIVLLVVVLCLSSFGCGTRIVVGTATLNGVTAALSNTNIQRNKNGRTVITSDVKITNDSEDNIMVVKFTLSCLDKDGNELCALPFTYNGQDKAIAPGAMVEYQVGTQKSIDGDIKAVSIRLMETKTDAEVPPIHLPITGEFLYEALNNENLKNIVNEPPTKIVVGIDQGGYLREAVLSDSEVLAQAVELFTAIRIGEETDTCVTDNYNYIIFTWTDGSETRISLNLKNLEVSVYKRWHYYELENMDSFWNMASSMAQDA
jgi:hypothetical protein